MCQALPGQEECKGYKDPQGDYIISYNQINEVIIYYGVCSEKE